MSEIVKLSGVSKFFGTTRVVHDIDLSIQSGEFISFLGPSGCGKTTTLRMIAGLESVSYGTIIIDGKKVNDSDEQIFVAPEQRDLGMVFQSYAVWPHMSVFDNIAYPLKIKKIPRREITERVNETLALVELDGLEKRMPSQLSGGQQQRVALGRGLVANPKVLLLDEPLSNLDAKLREKMRVDIRRIQQQLGITCIYVTHDQVEAFSMSDQIVVLNEGQIIQMGSPDLVRKIPIDQFVADFIN
jgi:iron(III) transport system ATP-binding protein